MQSEGLNKEEDRALLMEKGPPYIRKLTDRLFQRVPADVLARSHDLHEFMKEPENYFSRNEEALAFPLGFPLPFRIIKPGDQRCADCQYGTGSSGSVDPCAYVSEGDSVVIAPYRSRWYLSRIFLVREHDCCENDRSLEGLFSAGDTIPERFRRESLPLAISWDEFLRYS